MKYLRACIGICLTLILFNLAAVPPSWSASPDVAIIVQKAAPESAYFQDCISLTINGLDALLAKAKDKNKKIIPYLNGFPLKGIETAPVNNGILRFVLKRTPESKDAWKALLYHRENFFTKKVSLSVGLEDGQPEKTEVNNFTIDLIAPAWFKGSLVGGLVFLVFLIWLSNKSEILRNPGPAVEPGKKRRYSLALSQMAAWFGVIVYTFFIIWLITGELYTLTDSVLWLMGISAGTFLGAAAIDKSKFTETQGKKEKLQTEKTPLTEELKNLNEQMNKLQLQSPSPTSDIIALTTQITAKQARFNEIEAELKNLPASDAGPPSQNWLMDVLTDVNGISLHRFQILVWTIVLMIIFLSEVYNYLTMPEFSATLLGLMGISSGTYIGFKFPEQNPQ